MSDQQTNAAHYNMPIEVTMAIQPPTGKELRRRMICLTRQKSRGGSLGRTIARYGVVTNMMLTQEQEMIRNMAREFARRHLAPHSAEWERS